MVGQRGNTSGWGEGEDFFGVETDGGGRKARVCYCTVSVSVSVSVNVSVSVRVKARGAGLGGSS